MRRLLLMIALLAGAAGGSAQVMQEPIVNTASLLASMQLDAGVTSCTYTNVSSATSATCTLSSVPAGDTLICDSVYGDAGYNETITDSVNGQWSVVLDATDGGVYHDLQAIWAMPNSGAGTVVITIAYNVSTNSAGGGCSAYKNGRTTLWLDPNVAAVNPVNSSTTAVALASSVTPSAYGDLLYSTLSTENNNTTTAGGGFTRSTTQLNDHAYASYLSQTAATASTCPWTISPADVYQLQCAGFLSKTAGAGVVPYQGLIVNFAGLGTSAPSVGNLCLSASGSANYYVGALVDCFASSQITGWDIVNTHSDFLGTTSGPTSTFSSSYWLPTLSPYTSYSGNSTTNLQRTTGTSGDFIGAGVSPEANTLTWGGYVQTDVAQNDTNGHDYYFGGMFASGEYLVLHVVANGTSLTAYMAGQGYSDVSIGTFSSNTAYWVTGQFVKNGTEKMSLYTGCPSSCSLVAAVTHADGTSNITAQSLTFGSNRSSTETSSKHLYWRNFIVDPTNTYPVLP